MLRQLVFSGVGWVETFYDRALFRKVRTALRPLKEKGGKSANQTLIETLRGQSQPNEIGLFDKFQPVSASWVTSLARIGFNWAF